MSGLVWLCCTLSFLLGGFSFVFFYTNVLERYIFRKWDMEINERDNELALKTTEVQVKINEINAMASIEPNVIGFQVPDEEYWDDDEYVDKKK